MQNHKISVIIPVYNAEKTIGIILEKLISQSYQNIEIIAVNDGSKDDSWKVLQKFAKKDKRVIAIDQKNAGASAARNAGINRSAGKFITFIDSDDDISPELISELIQHATDDTSLVMCGMMLNGNAIIAPDAVVSGKDDIMRYALKSLLTKNLLYGPYCKLFRRDIVVKNGIKFPMEVKYGEDTIFVMTYLKFTSVIAVIGKALYIYNFQQTGLASANNTNKGFRKARLTALNSFMGTRPNFLDVSLYLLIRLRWLASYWKGIVR